MPLSEAESGVKLPPSLAGKGARGVGPTAVTAPQSLRIENAATRSLSRFQDAWAARDWDGIASTFAPGGRVSDRRSYAHLDLDRDQHLASLRFRFEMRSSRVTHEVLATRGQRLALYWSRFELADGDVGPSETESLGLTETDERGDVVALVMFDPNDLDAAYAELDARYAAGEAAPYGPAPTMLWKAVADRDWDGLTASLAPDFVLEDHRPLGWPTMNAATYVESVKALVDLAPDARWRRDHVVALEQKCLWITTLSGTREGGVFEDRRVGVFEFDDQGRIRRFHFYALDQLDEARARFEELRAENSKHETRNSKQIRNPKSE
jgi:SnoaL-like protein